MSSKSERRMSTLKNVRSFLGENRWPLLFASLIVCLTSIFVPILYSTKSRSVEQRQQIFDWNSQGQTVLRANGQFGEIASLVIDGNNRILLLDRTFGQILRFDVEQQQLTILVENKTSEFNSPQDFSLDAVGNIYVADTGNRQVLVFSPSGGQRTVLNVGQLTEPSSVTIDGQKGILYIADYGSDRLVSYNLQTNVFLVVGSVRSPISIRFDSSDGTLIVGQGKAFNVVRWNLLQSSSTFLAGSINGDLNGTSRTLFNQICSVSTDQMRHFYVVDCQNQRIQMFDKDQVKGRTILGVIQAEGNNSYLFSHPTSIAFDSKFNLYVADSLNYRIQFFRNRNSQ